MNEETLFQYQVKTKSQYGTRFYYFYADTDIENYLNNKNIKYVRYAKDTALNKKEKRIRELFKENKQLQQENQSLKDRIEKKDFIINELEQWLKEEIKQYDNVGLKFKKQGNFECASRSYDYLKQYQIMLSKLQELKGDK